MFSFRSLQEIEDASVTPVLRRVARDALTRLVQSYADTGYPYNPDVDGYIVLSDETGDDPGLAQLLGRPFPEVLLEDVDYERKARCFVAVFLSNNEFGLSILVPDTPALLSNVREKLLTYLPEEEAERLREEDRRADANKTKKETTR